MTQQEVDRLLAKQEEFRVDLAAMSTDIALIKRDVADLIRRLEAMESKQSAIEKNWWTLIGVFSVISPILTVIMSIAVNSFMKGIAP